MKKLIKYFKFLVLNILIGNTMAQSESVTYITPSSTYVLNKNEFNNLKLQAERGNSDAAIKLAKYYALGARDLPFEERRKQELFWWECAAKQNNILAIKTVIDFYIDNNDFSKAKYWLNKLPKQDLDRINFKNKILQNELNIKKEKKP